MKTQVFILNLDTSYPSSSTPIVAVRQEMNKLISQRAKELEKINSQSKSPRSKRLANNIGLNVTDDEFLLMKLNENEEEKRQKRKCRQSKHSNVTSTSSSTTTNVTKRRGRPPKKGTDNSQQIHSNDPEIEASICSLQSVINMANYTLNSDDPDGG